MFRNTWRNERISQSSAGKKLTTLVVGFDSAWTQNHSGAIVAARYSKNAFHEVCVAQPADFAKAENLLRQWQSECEHSRTVIMIDQPTIVRNDSGQRPVEKIVSPSVSVRYGGMQPANTTRTTMFGSDAPIWPFLSRCGGVADPIQFLNVGCIFETYPVLVLIALGWTLPDARSLGRLPKYNPVRKKTFSQPDWQHVCSLASNQFSERGLSTIANWLGTAGNGCPRKADQDCLDACLCLLAGLYLVEGRCCLMVGDTKTGYIVVPYGETLCAELEHRCREVGLPSSEWVRPFNLSPNL